MMMKLIGSLSVLLLVGCKPVATHTELLEDPEKLQRAFLQCDANEKLDKEYCAMVKRTHEEFESFMAVRAANPERYGQQILLAEQESASLLKKMQSLPQNSDERAKAEVLYLKQLQKVNMLLAVVRASYHR